MDSSSSLSRIDLIRFLKHFYTEVINDQILLRAGALTYVTLLSLVPILAVCVSIIDVFGKSEGFARMVVERVAAGSPETVDRIVEIVQRANFSGLGTLGGIVAFMGSILAIGNIEKAFNRIWGIRKSRTWIRRFSDYLTVLVVAPLLVAVGISLATTLNSQTLVQRFLEIPFFARTYNTGLQYVPFVALCLAFTLLYLILPNTKVKVTAALTGGVVAAILFNAAQQLYVGLNIGGAKVSAVFGGFAALPLLFVWIYLSWILILFGAAVAYAAQNYRRIEFEWKNSFQEVEPSDTMGLLITLKIARAFRDSDGGLSPEYLAESLNLRHSWVVRSLELLGRAGIVSSRLEKGNALFYQLGRPAEKISALEVWHVGRQPGDRRKWAGKGDKSLERFFSSLEKAEQDAVGDSTLASLLEEENDQKIIY